MTNVNPLPDKRKGDASSKADVTSSSNTNVDVSHILNDYVGTTRIRRLLYVASHVHPSQSLPIFTQLLSELSSSQQPTPSLYMDVLNAAKARHPDLQLITDTSASAYLSIIEKQQSDSIKQIENQLTHAKRDGDRGLIYEAFIRYADIYYQYGDYQQALNKYLESKEWTPNIKATIYICMQIIKCSILQGTGTQVKTQAQRVQAAITQIETTNASNTTSNNANNEINSMNIPLLQTQVNASLGLYYLKVSSYGAAAHHFLSCTSILYHNYSEILSLHDCMIYGTLCALASYTRLELKQKLLLNSEWRNNIHYGVGNEDLMIYQHIIQAYIENDYHQVMLLLQQQSSSILLFDRLLAHHLSILYKEIQSRILILLFSTYSHLPLSIIQDQLLLNHIDEVERMIADLIYDGKLTGKIDTAAKLLVQRDNEVRMKMYHDAQLLADRILRDGAALLMRMSLIENDISLKIHKNKGGGIGNENRDSRDMER